MTEKHKLEPAINQKLTTGEKKTSKEQLTWVSWHLSPRYSHVTMASRYSIMTAVKLTIICMSIIKLDKVKMAGY